MFFEIGAPVFDASIPTLTGDVCAAHTIERKRSAGKTTDILHLAVLIADCMMNGSVVRPRHLNGRRRRLGLSTHRGRAVLIPVAGSGHTLSYAGSSEMAATGSGSAGRAGDRFAKTFSGSRTIQNREDFGQVK
jgi:hypothetical protein